MAWRARIHYLSRDPRFLLRTTLLILAAGLGLALLIASTAPGAALGARTDWMQKLLEGALDAAKEHLREGYQELERASEPQPRKLARWLRRAAQTQVHEESESSATVLVGYEIDGLLSQHASDAMTRQLFTDYITLARDAQKPDAQAEARLRERAKADPPQALANQLLAQWLVQREETEEALGAFVREGRFFADADAARAEALHWAVHLQQTALVKELLAEPGWIGAADPAVVYHAAGMAGDVWLQWKTLLKLRLRDLPALKLGLAMFAAGLWYAILVPMAGLQGRWRWAVPLLPMMAGVVSIWPTLSLVEFQRHHLGLSEDAPFPHNLWYYFGGIGLREELCKLALFTPFLPWLLRKRQAGLALVTGAFVGLGFALEENLEYYDPTGGSVVWARFITANFLHAAMTGIAAHGLYLAVRSGFHRVSDFAGAFLMVVVAHGLYDLVLMEDREWLGISFLHIVILGFLANHFFSLLAQETGTRRGRVSPAALYILGSALLVAALMVAAAPEGGRQAISNVAMGCLSVVPVGFLFRRHLE